MSVIRLSTVRRISMALLLSMVLTLLSGAPRAVPSAEAATTAAVSGVVQVNDVSEVSSSTPKTAIAYCPLGKRVVGGGAGTFHSDYDSPPLTTLALMELRPVRTLVGTTLRDAYVATAGETPPGTTRDWGVNAYAVCADPLPGMSIVSATTTWSSNSMQATAASCGGGVVLGTGASIWDRSGNVVLQVARPSTTGASALVQAQEGAAGYTSNWNVTAYAICVPTKPAGYQVVFAESSQSLSESRKSAFVSCPSGKQWLGSGAAISNIAPGHVSLQHIDPRQGQTYVRAAENTPLFKDWDFIVATVVCAY